jgi:murein DD-endopeptidase MepM/ murein hydrolase activator NlpD
VQLRTIWAVLLLCAAISSVAVLEFVRDGTDVPLPPPQQLVTPLPVVALASPDLAFRLFRTDTTRANDTLERLLARLGVVDAKALAFLQADARANQVLLARAGRLVTAEMSRKNQLHKLTVRWPARDGELFNRWVAEKVPGGFATRLESVLLTASKKLASATIRTSLFADADQADIPESVVAQVIEIFSGEIDFHRTLRPGDRFSVVYEVLEADGEPLAVGRVLSAEFVNNGRAFSAVWYLGAADNGHTLSLGPGAYYTLDGQSLRHAFLATPIAVSRMSSGFALRFHPILQVWKRHLGVDYPAPVGTPVRSVGDGVVQFAGVQKGFGKVVYVKHRNRYTTVYAHLSRILVRLGQAVSQSQIIGAVGSSGWATGPHLHFEYRLNGVYQDPMKVARQTASLRVVDSAAFRQVVARSRLELAAAASLQPGSTP